jgi:predicted helicase
MKLNLGIVGILTVRSSMALYACRLASGKLKMPRTTSTKRSNTNFNAGNGIITIDSETKLAEIPPTTWQYRLGTRSALEWVLDQYKEKEPKDLTVRRKFNTYRFSDHKEKVIDLLTRITRVSIETEEILKEMREKQSR